MTRVRHAARIRQLAGDLAPTAVEVDAALGRLLARTAARLRVRTGDADTDDRDLAEADLPRAEAVLAAHARADGLQVDDPGWVHAERERLWAAVSALRAARGHTVDTKWTREPPQSSKRNTTDPDGNGDIRHRSRV